MIAGMLDRSSQIAVQRPVVVPTPLPTQPFSSGRPLLTSYYHDFPPECERAVTLLDQPEVQHFGSWHRTTVLHPDLRPTNVLLVQNRSTAFEPGPSGSVYYSFFSSEERHREREVLPFAIAVQRLIESDQLSVARTMLEAAPIHVVNDSLILCLRRVLAPPVVQRTSKRDVDRRTEYEWLRTEGHRYRGQWVAVLGNQLLAVAPTLRELRRRISTMTLAHPPLLQRVEAEDD